MIVTRKTKLQNKVHTKDISLANVYINRNKKMQNPSWPFAIGPLAKRNFHKLFEDPGCLWAAQTTVNDKIGRVQRNLYYL